MKLASLLVCLSALPLGAQVNPEGYAASLGDFKGAHCEFKPLSAPPTPAVVLDLKRSDVTADIIWMQEGVFPLPVLGGVALPTGATSFVAPVADGWMAMVSYTESGKAMLSRQASNGRDGIMWRVQPGTCVERKNK